jgi:hypothetical protein
MNTDEKIAFDFLKEHFGKVPTFEPNGNVPPDFSYGNLGIEVRRLNENYYDKDTGKAEGLEIVYHNIHKILLDVLPSFDDRYSGNSYFTNIKYQHPLKLQYKSFKNGLKLGLKDFLDSEIKTPHQFKINDTISIQIIKGTSKRNKVFRNGIISDWNGGRLLIPMITENITYCISEKSEKIETYKGNYSEWWLLLVDHLIIFCSKEDKKDLLDEDIGVGNFDKVIIINPSNKKLLLEF